MKHYPRNRRGVLTFEWLVIITLLVIGMVSSLGVLRTSLYKTCEILPEGVSSICGELPTEVSDEK